MFDKEKTCEQRIDAQFESRLASLDVPEECEECKGSGEIECPSCGGEGTLIIDDPPNYSERDCPDCDGEGTVKCPDCYGDGTNEEAAGYQDPLCIDKYTVYHICLSTGGPADGFRLKWDGDGWAGGEYYFQDWFDGATRSISAAHAERVAQVYGVYVEGQ